VTERTISGPIVSVIIPTHNRKDRLLRSLQGLSKQTYPADKFEVIIVDDGGQSCIDVIVQDLYPYHLSYIRQQKNGAAIARNNGAIESLGEVLVFMDDDIVPGPSVIAELAEEVNSRFKTIVLGVLRLPSQIIENSAFAHDTSLKLNSRCDLGYVSFQCCMTGLLAIKRKDFFRLEMFQDPTDGWPSWDDIDFGYRASKAGYRFWRSGEAGADHWDIASTSLDHACDRWYRAGKSAPQLFLKHPQLKALIPMFRDKEPVSWRQDRPGLIIRKFARRILSVGPMIRLLEETVICLERWLPDPNLLSPLYRLIVGGYIFNGYREGMQETIILGNNVVGK